MKRVTAALILCLLPLAAPAAAASDTAFGVRAGLTLDPDQIHFGGHVQAVQFAEGFWLVPNLEIGFGDHATLFALNGEVNYTFPRADWKQWRPYVGGGLGYNITKLDDAGMPAGFDDTHTDIGLNVLVGVARTLNLGYDFFGELKLGIEDSPDAKITLGLTFH
jgi:hypothetical protein